MDLDREVTDLRRRVGILEAALLGRPSAEATQAAEPEISPELHAEIHKPLTPAPAAPSDDTAADETNAGNEDSGGGTDPNAQQQA